MPRGKKPAVSKHDTASDLAPKDESVSVPPPGRVIERPDGFYWE